MNHVAKNTPSVQQRLSQAIADPRVSERLSKSLTQGINQEQFIAQLQISLGDRKLKDCTYESLYNAAHFCATLALLPSLQQVALIPREMKKDGKVWGVLCIPMPQWQGYKAIMERHPDVLEAVATLVHANDEFAVARDNVTGVMTVHHKFNPLDGSRQFNGWNDVQGGYLEVTYRDRSRPNKYHFTTKQHMQKSADCAETEKLWKAWFEKMLRKTIYRDAFSSRVVNLDVLTADMLASINRVDDQALGNDPSRVETPQPKALPQSRADRLANSLPDDRTFDATPTHHEDPEPEPEPEPAKKPARKASKKAEKKAPPEPPVPDHLGPARDEMLAAKNTTELQELVNLWAKSEEDYLALEPLASWLIETGKVPSDAPRQQNEMFEKSEHPS